MFFFFFKQKTAYEMRISDWSSDVCSSDLDIDLGTRDLAHLIRIVNVVVRQRMIGRNVGDDCDVTPIVGQAFVQDGGAVVFKYGGVDHAIEQNLARRRPIRHIARLDFSLAPHMPLPAHKADIKRKRRAAGKGGYVEGNYEG